MKPPGFTLLLSRVRGFAAALLLSATAAHAQNFTGYDLVVPKSLVPNEVTVVDGSLVTIPTNRSFIIGIEGGAVRNPIEFKNWTGTAQFPIVITNMHGTGRVQISDEVPGNSSATKQDGINMVGCKYVQLRGDNDPSMRYGIQILRAGGINAGSGHRGVEVGGISSDVEISYLEIQDVAFCGIMVKQDPNCDPLLSYPSLVYRNISIHDNYIHDVGGEAMYVGYSFFLDDKCTADANAGYAHPIEGLRIYNNLCERARWDGIQVGSAWSDVEIHHNVIIDPGQGGSGSASGDTGVGVQIGAGTTGLLHSNLIINSRQNGISVFGLGNNIVYNNLVWGGTVGIFLDNRGDATKPADRITQTGAPFYVFNNTFVGQSNHVMWTMSQVTDNQFKNNLVIGPTDTALDLLRWDGTATGVDAGNVLQRNTTGITFANTAAKDYRILTGSTNAENKGVPVSQVPQDLFGIDRPQDTDYDAGYSEAHTLSVSLNATPPTGTSSNGSITALAINGSTPYTYAWSTGATTATISGLAPGSYSVTVTDNASRVVKKATYLFADATFGAPIALTPPTQVEAPTFNSPSGTYATSRTVTISTATSGATIRYTTNGTTPTATTGTVYSGPITVSSTGSVKAVAYKTGMTTSAVSVATYLIGVPPGATTLAVSSVSDRRIELSWPTVANATRYEIAYATSPTGPFISLGAFTGTSYTHYGLTNGTTYYYTITAASVYGRASTSAIASATPFPYSGTIGVLSGFTPGPTTVSSVNPANGFNAQPTWNSTTQRPEGDDPVPHSTTGTTTASRFWMIDFGTNYASYHITEMWTRYRPNSPGDMPGFPIWWWDDDIDATNDGVNELEMNFQTTQAVPNIGAQLWFRDRDFGVAPIRPLNRYLVIGTGSVLTGRPNEFALIGWKDGAAAAPTVVQQPQAQNVPAGSNVSFTVGVTGSPEPSYQWRKNGVNISGQTGPWLYLPNVQSANAGTYSVVVTNASGSATSTGATLTVGGSGSLGVDLQAEDAVLFGALARTNQTGYTGTGFVDYINASGDYIEWTATMPSSGSRTLTFRYASTGSPRLLEIKVNGTVVDTGLAFPNTGGANIWTTLSTTATLPAGTVTIRATATGTSGPNMDYLRID